MRRHAAGPRAGDTEVPGTGDKPGSGGTGGAVGRRYALPSDLSGSLGHLDDAQFARLLQAVVEEARRRGRRIAGDRTPSRASGSATAPGPAPAGGGGAKKRRPRPLAPGQARLIRAAFEAGVKPAAIARQLRVSRTQVQQVLSGYSQRKD